MHWNFNSKLNFLAGPAVASLYPSLDEYMGLNLHSDEVRQNVPQNLSVVPAQPNQVAVVNQRPSQITGKQLFHLNYAFVWW